MDYFILDENNQQIGPFSIDQLKSKNIRRTTKVWCQGMQEWSDAETVQDLKDLFIIPPPPNIPPPFTQRANSNDDLNKSNYSHAFTSNTVYEEHFNVSNLSSQELEDYKKNLFFDTFSTGVGILLHYLTFAIFTTIYCGLKHSKLPKIKSDDFGGGKAIGFLFIPFFNFYWIFIFWRRLAMRINLQFKLRNEHPPVSLGLATTVCILTFIPYVGVISFLVLMPILFSQIQSASNKLARENMTRSR